MRPALHLADDGQDLIILRRLLHGGKRIGAVSPAHEVGDVEGHALRDPGLCRDMHEPVEGLDELERRAGRMRKDMFGPDGYAIEHGGSARGQALAESRPSRR